MFEISGKIDSRKAIAELHKLHRDQVPYATAVALTRVANAARDEIKRELPSEFHIRRPWTLSGMRTDMAKKGDWPNTASRVGSIDPYMIDFEEGGEHTHEGTRATGIRSRVGSTAFVVPVEIRKALGIDVKQVIPRAQWPARIAGRKAPRGRKGAPKKPIAFFATVNGRHGIFVRTGETEQVAGKRGARKRDRITLLWAMRKTPSKAPGKHWLTKPTTKVYQQRMQPEFDKALAKAISEAR